MGMECEGTENGRIRRNKKGMGEKELERDVMRRNRKGME
jgi:hypothetical protein